ncbi:ATP-binding protein [Yoonia sp. SS1-5]|uniref:C4-dicarboxylate transport sensor protein DctB n=1 Tax=Yoonia rhodophyticola TaxID=3137370 RepID=A0AAN0NJE0_9RHOB
MHVFLRPRLFVIIAFLLAVAAFSAGVWWYGYRVALNQLEDRAKSDLALASDTLTSEVRRLREAAVLMADHPALLPMLAGQSADDTAIQAIFQEVADKTGAIDIMLLDADGQRLLGTVQAGLRDHANRPYFERAMDGALGSYNLYSAPFGRRAFVFAAPVFAAEGPVIGAVVLYADVAAIEASWRTGASTVFFSDRNGVIFVSNRSEMVFRLRLDDLMQAARAGAYPIERLAPFVNHDSVNVSGHDLWRVDGGRYLPGRALHLTLDLPVIDMTGEVLVDAGPARELASLQAAVVAAVCLAFGLLSFITTQRRRTLAVLNAKLERRVRDRTAALQTLNADLRREVAERTAAEHRLQKAQDDLVQAGKLSALGQMSAGISHELNQPLMAIRSFAENAQGFLARDKPDVAAKNLGRISEMARRMGRIIGNLRAFARQEDEPLKDVDLVSAIEAALEIVGPRAKNDDVEINWARPSAPIWVRGGEVRLQQVILNLISNGIDAMEESAPKVLEIAVSETGQRAVLSIRDTGPGIDAPEKIFEPFYTTKAIGSAEGMGLGLSISYGLVQSFGGDIRGRNHPDGGAIFTIELDAAAKRIAA